MRNDVKQKKPYAKPVATRFPLRPDEAVLGFCKSNAATGPYGPGCIGTPTCSTVGS